MTYATPNPSRAAVQYIAVTSGMFNWTSDTLLYAVPVQRGSTKRRSIQIMPQFDMLAAANYIAA